ncbi:MAG: glycosyltransferase family 39 protein [Cyclobacteriaceae bacterium]|nr:glycosyltransferase family 39 protein [Cyclobacteriaceae bacterium]
MPKINAKNLILITIISFVLISSNIGGLYIYALDEAKNSVCAREMLDRGDLVVPTFNHELRTDKPPLHYYFMQIAYLIFGVNEFSARFFSVIMGILTILTSVWLATRYLGERAGFYTAIVLLSSLHFVLQFHMAVPDPYLIFLTTSGLAAFYVFYREEKPAFLLVSYLAFGLGSLTKGPVALALPGLSVLIFLLLNKKLNRRYLLQLKPLWVLGVFLLVILPWYLLVSLRTDGEWTREFFFYHNVGRYTNTMEGHGAIFLVTPLFTILGMLPFAVFLIQSFRTAWKKRNENQLLFFSMVIILTIVVFFSFSETKLPNYTVPAYPFLAILAGYYLSGLQDHMGKHMKINLITLAVYSILMIVFPVAVYFALGMDPELDHLRHLAFYFLILPAGGFIGLYFTFRNSFKGMVIALSVSWILVILLFFHIIFPRVDQQNPVAETIGKIDRDLPVAAYKIYNPAFSFYIPKHFTELDSRPELEEYITELNGYIITRKSLGEELENIPQLKKIAEAKDIFEIPTTVIYQIERDLPAGQ